MWCRDVHVFALSQSIDGSVPLARHGRRSRFVAVGNICAIPCHLQITSGSAGSYDASSGRDHQTRIWSDLEQSGRESSVEPGGRNCPRIGAEPWLPMITYVCILLRSGPYRSWSALPRNTEMSWLALGVLYLSGYGVDVAAPIALKARFGSRHSRTLAGAAPSSRRRSR